MLASFTFKSLSISNRIVMAPRGDRSRPTATGVSKPANIAAARKAGGRAAMADRPSTRNEPTGPSFYGKPTLAGWRRVIDASGLLS